MIYKIVDQILVVQDTYFFDPDSLIIFSKTCASDPEEEVIRDFQKNRPVETSKVSIGQDGTENGIDHENPEYGKVNIELHVTDDCTLQCRYCYAEEACNKYKKLSMSENVIEQTFTLARNSFPNAKVVDITLFGGEPLLFYKKFPFILRKCQEIFEGKKVEISIPTNGSFINKDILSFLSRDDVLFQISWDGKEDQQNRLRPTKTGKESYQMVDSNLSHFAKITDSLAVRATITPFNLRLSELFTFFKQKGFKKLNFGICFSGPKDVVVEKKHFSQLFEEWNKLVRLYLQHVVEDETVIQIIPLLRFLMPLHYGTKNYHYCGMSKNLFAVSPEGTIYSCHRFVRNESHRIGSLSEGFDKKAKTSTNIRVTNKERCSDCFARFLCGGGCPHDQTFGSFDLSCSYNQHLAALCVWLYGELSNRYPKSLKKLFPETRKYAQDIASGSINH
jgi:uncharacterized protein